MANKKSFKMPNVSEDRIDKGPVDTSQGITSKEKKAHAFIKGREQIERFTLRLPKNLYEFIRSTAFKNKISLNQIIVDALEKEFQGKK